MCQRNMAARHGGGGEDQNRCEILWKKSKKSGRKFDIPAFRIRTSEHQNQGKRTPFTCYTRHRIDERKRPKPLTITTPPGTRLYFTNKQTP